jgi:hypothetical protein
MEAIINAIAEHIENWTQDYVASSPLEIKNWGWAELVNRVSKGKISTSTQPIPVPVSNPREQIAIDDRYDFIEWIRIASPVQIIPSDEDSWGLRVGKRQRLPLRIVIAHKTTLGEDLVFNLVNELPDNIVLTGFDFIFVNTDGNIDTDHETIYNTELGATVYEQHRFTWNVYVINLDIEYIPCVGFTPPEYITDEFGNCLFA